MCSACSIYNLPPDLRQYNQRNSPCFSISDGFPHMQLSNRVRGETNKFACGTQRSFLYGFIDISNISAASEYWLCHHKAIAKQRDERRDMHAAPIPHCSIVGGWHSGANYKKAFSRALIIANKRLISQSWRRKISAQCA